MQDTQAAGFPLWPLFNQPWAFTLYFCGGIAPLGATGPPWVRPQTEHSGGLPLKTWGSEHMLSSTACTRQWAVAVHICPCCSLTWEGEWGLSGDPHQPFPRRHRPGKASSPPSPGWAAVKRFRESALFSLRPGLRSPGQDSALGSGAQRPRQRREEA